MIRYIPIRWRVLSLVLLSPSFATAEWFDGYKNLVEIYAEIDAMAAEYPTLVTPISIGRSYEGREIRGFKISTSNPTAEARPAIVINGTQHAREWISPMTNMYMARQLVDGYGISDNVSSLVDEIDYYVIPVVNPDGYEYSWTDERLWRKNRRDNGDGTFGVDLNRNWDFEWGRNDGSSSDTNDPTYRGTEPFSEPETRALRDFFLDHQNIVATIDYHAFSQLILYPFGYSALAISEDEPLLASLANRMAESIESVNGEVYLPIPAHEFYPVSGASIDWTYGSEGVYSYTIELRPTEVGINFQLPADEILPTVEENWPAFLDLGEFVASLSSGDFNVDGVLDCMDAEALGNAIQHGTNKAEFDLNGDGEISASDQLTWQAKVGVPIGDANLDGKTTQVDFEIWRANAFAESVSLCRGDFNADGSVDVSDFNLWNGNRSPEGHVVVPEPCLPSMFFWAVLLGLPRFRDRHVVLQGNWNE